MWPFKKKTKQKLITPDDPKYKEIMNNLQCSQTDITDRFGDNLRLKPDEWIETRPINLKAKTPESMGLPPLNSTDNEIYEIARKMSTLREKINPKLVPNDGVYCPICHIANITIEKLHTPCPKCGRKLLKFGWD